MAMIQPVNAPEQQYAFALAALQMHVDDQANEGHRQAADTYLDAKREMAAAGEAIYKDRNPGLIEYANVLAAQEDKPPAFVDFLENQTKSALRTRAEKHAPERDDDGVLVVEKPNASENIREIEGQRVRVVQPDTETLIEEPTSPVLVLGPVDDPNAVAPAKRRRSAKKETDRG